MNEWISLILVPNMAPLFHVLHLPLIVTPAWVLTRIRITKSPKSNSGYFPGPGKQVSGIWRNCFLFRSVDVTFLLGRNRDYMSLHNSQIKLLWRKWTDTSNYGSSCLNPLSFTTFFVFSLFWLLFLIIWSRGWQTMALGPNLTWCLFLSIKFYWNTVTPNCFLPAIIKLSRRDRQPTYPQTLKYLLSCLLEKKLANPWHIANTVSKYLYCFFTSFQGRFHTKV